MNNLKVLLIAGFASLVVASGVTYFRPVTKEIVREVIKEVAKSPTLGAIPGNEINADRVVVNGLNLVTFNQPFNFASSTLCSINLTASSTLLHADLKVTTGSTSALYLEIGKARNSISATTTSLGNGAIGVSEVGQFRASTTAAGLNGVLEFGPDDFLNFNAGGFVCDSTDNTCTSLRGECNAVFIE